MTQKEVVTTDSKANEDIISILLDQDELTWQNIIYELVNTEQMDPWDIDVSKLAKRFLAMIHTLQEMDFRITGKLVLAAALLLKIKSNQLLKEDMTALDDLIAGADDPIDLLEELPLAYPDIKKEEEKPQLIPKTPQPRKRKVSVDDLVDALGKALELEVRRTKYDFDDVEIEVPTDTVDISSVIMEVYKQVHEIYKSEADEITFNMLIPEEASKEQKVFTFIPLLHLDHQRNIDLNQKESFGEIFIVFLKELEGDFKVDTGDLGA
ncbi:segregation/condensation protein A [Nanoarchaeota archaeon]